MSDMLKELAHVEYGASPKEVKANDITPVGIYGTSGLLGYATESLFNAPLVVVARKGTLDNPVYVSRDCWVIDTAYAVLPFGEIDAKWLYYQLANYDLKRLNESTGVPSISRDYLYRIRFNKVSLPEQRKIARILSTVDEVIEWTEAAIGKYQAIKQGMMHDLFTRGLDHNGKLRPRREEAPELYHQTALGWLPKEWVVLKIGNFAQVKGGKRLPAGQEFSDMETLFPYIRVTDMVNGTVNQSDLKYVPVDIEPFIRPYKISAKDVYVTIAGTLGLFGTIPAKLDNAQLTENAAKITGFDHNHFDRDFIKHQCNSEVIQSQVNREIGVGGGVPKLALYRIARFDFIEPHIEEQIKIASMINGSELLINDEKNHLGKITSVKQALMQDLLTGRKAVVL